MKYGDAKQIARVLTDMFVGGSSSSLLDSADNQIAPGSGTHGDVEPIACRSTPTSTTTIADSAAVTPRRERAAASGRAQRLGLRRRWRRQPDGNLRPARQGKWRRRQRTAAAAGRPDHPRRRQQLAPDLCRSRQLQDHRIDAAAGRSTAAAGRDRRHDRRSRRSTTSSATAFSPI